MSHPLPSYTEAHSSMRNFDLRQLQSLGVDITRLVSDSRAVSAGDTFVAYQGEYADGRLYIAQAIANGANAVIWDAQNFSWRSDWAVPNLAVWDLREHAGEIASHVYAQPSSKLWMVGITGTNGKTSCSHWLANSLTRLGRKSALIGTLGNGFAGALQATANTTPDSLIVQNLLGSFVQQGAQAAVMEVSSHALTQGRVNGVHYDVALLTNLTRDHLDYHGDMQSYAQAKRRLFDWDSLRYAVLNLDDIFGAELVETLRDRQVQVIGYGLTDAALKLAERLGIRMVYGNLTQMNAQGLTLQLHTSWGGAEIHSALLGRFNAENLLGALAVLLVSDVALADATRVLGEQLAVAGRMQSVGGKGVPAVVVDYAHTPDALEKVLLSLRELTDGSGELICVFGCGGDRDRGKRPMMGRVAAKFADVRIVTSDNPRSESPRAIMDEIIGDKQSEFLAIEDRAQAIAHAISHARANDTVLIAGKGHEGYQEIAGVRHTFSDVVVAQQALSTWQAKEIRT
ncbi:MAG: UDP-N-acetylmuramoyl-L-alanyl-D-glutamate--2,6-diaminopimelate ligase [Sideroxydans sp.]|nr:UDP-N-acetylmuramoyl-L-alanyl-D-glutamate--2,6-diaminopimelate ligase [Sideroxydans sp.]